MTPRPYILHALSPLHAGIGQAAELIDLPIARMTSTRIPFVPGSSIKGVLRDAANQAGDDATVAAVFGPPSKDDERFAGAIVCTDARLLALPVRSFRGTFAFVTSPLLLELANRDLGSRLPIPVVESGAMVSRDSRLIPAVESNGQVLTGARSSGEEPRIYLEDLDLAARTEDTKFGEWLAKIGRVFGGQAEAHNFFGRRFVVVDDETMTFLWETATQLDQRVSIDPETRTAAKGQLWLEESLPPETLLLGQLLAEQSRSTKTPMQPDGVLDYVLGKERTLQFGGKSTIGRGRCRMVPL